MGGQFGRRSCQWTIAYWFWNAHRQVLLPLNNEHLDVDSASQLNGVFLGSLLSCTLLHMHFDQLYVSWWNVYHLPCKCDKCVWPRTRSLNLLHDYVRRVLNVSSQFIFDQMDPTSNKFHDPLLRRIIDLDSDSCSALVVQRRA